MGFLSFPDLLYFAFLFLLLKGGVTHEVHIVNWNTGILKAQSGKTKTRQTVTLQVKIWRG